jgi:hypothetical protein
LQRKLEKQIEVGVMLHSVAEAIEWFSNNEHPDLIFRHSIIGWIVV